MSLRPATQGWYAVADLGKFNLDSFPVKCRKPESSSPHARWSAGLRAADQRERLAGHPDGHLPLHSTALPGDGDSSRGPAVAKLSGRSTETLTHQPVPKTIGRLPEQVRSGQTGRLSRPGADSTDYAVDWDQIGLL